MKLFGTDGVRGVANVEPMTPERVFALGQAAAATLCSDRASRRRPAVVLGRDTRISGHMLEGALVAAFCSAGVDVYRLGIAPTPAVAYLTRELGADAGCVVSASHNPFADNGIKFFSADGFKLPDDTEGEIEGAMATPRCQRPTGQDIGQSLDAAASLSRYAAFCVAAAGEIRPFDGLQLVLDCANGAAYRVAPDIFRQLGAKVHVLFDTPDGSNINEACGAQHTDALRAEVLARNADAGLAFDGDADRLIVVSEKGDELSGDHVLAACACHLKNLAMLPGTQVVTTVMSNFGFRLAMQDAGIVNHVCAVGDRYVLQRMQETGSGLGGEASGHIIFLPDHSTGDGIFAGIKLLMASHFRQCKLSELCSIMQNAPQQMINIEVTAKPDLASLGELSEAVAAANALLSGRGRILIRYSGTQPMCRVMVEGPDSAVTDRICEQLATIVQRLIGV